MRHCKAVLPLTVNPGVISHRSERLSEVLAALKGKDLTRLMSQSDMNHSRGLIDVEFTIERGANV
jgi:branched-chain amino acid transport system ATP-binding protein